MFLPIGDTPNPQRFTPWVNYTLIGLNIAIFVFITLPLSSKPVNPADPAVAEYLQHILSEFPQFTTERLLAQTSAYDLFTFAHGYQPGRPQIVDLFSAMFLHGGFGHLGGNMLFLWIFGDNVEHRVGRLKYLLIYLVTGVFATWAFALFAGDSMTPLVGASGAISGVLGLYFIMFPRNQVKVFILFFPFFFNVVLIPCRLVLGFYVIVQNLFPFLFGAQSSTAYGAHLGGFIAGFGIAYLGERLAWSLSRRDRLGTAGRRRPVAAQRNSDPASLGDLRAALSDEDDDKLAVAFNNLGPGQIESLNADETIRLADWLFTKGQPIAASELLRRAIGRHRTGTERDLASLYLAMGTLRLRQGQNTRAYQHFLAVLDLDAEPETKARARHALTQIDVYTPTRRR